MPNPVGIALGSAGAGLVGSSMQADAASDAATGQAEAARVAAEASAFRPVGLTTRFGRSGYTYDSKGNIVGAGYQVAPDLAAMREGLIGMAGGNLANVQAAAMAMPQINQSAKSLWDLGNKYVATSPEQAAQSWMSNQQALLAPQNEQALAKVRNSLQQQGRAGLAFGATEAGNRAATNPEMAAYYNSLAQQNAQLATQADQYGMDRSKFGAGMLGSGLNLAGEGINLQVKNLDPWKAYLGAANTVEGMGQGAMDASSALGAKQSTAGANQAQYLARAGGGGTGYSPVGAGLMGLANNPQFTNALGGLFSGGQPPTGYTQQPGFTNTPNYLTWQS
jgi:hypothetical protein